MKKLYLVEFSQTLVEDGVLRPVLPWDGLAANVHCVYPRAEKGRYVESHVMAAVEADAKVHAEIAQAEGVSEMPDDADAKLKDVPSGKRAEVDAKVAALKIDTRDVTDDTPVKVVLDRMGAALKPGFDLARLQPAAIEVSRGVR